MTLYDLIPNPIQILTGVGIGIIVSMPLGPVNLLCLQRAIERGFWGGMAAGIGTLLGDGLISFVAAWGISSISQQIAANRGLIQVIGGIVLAVFGLRLFLARPRMVPVLEEHGSTLGTHLWVIPQTFFLTVTNPAAILGVFAIFGSASSMLAIDSFPEAVEVTLAVMGGAFLWWFLMSWLISLFRHRLTERGLKLINQGAGLVLIGFAVLVTGEPLLIRR